MGRTTCHEWIIDSKWSRARARIVSFLWQTGVIEVRPHLHTISTRVSIYHFRQSRISSTGERLRDASHSAWNGTVSAVDGSSITFPSRTPSSARCPRFHRCALNNFHRQHSLNVPGFGPRNRPRNPRPRSSRIELLFPSFPKS